MAIQEQTAFLIKVIMVYGHPVYKLQSANYDDDEPKFVPEEQIYIEHGPMVKGDNRFPVPPCHTLVECFSKENTKKIRDILTEKKENFKEVKILWDSSLSTAQLKLIAKGFFPPKFIKRMRALGQTHGQPVSAASKDVLEETPKPAAKSQPTKNSKPGD